MDENVQGRTVVITGAAHGIGKAWALGFLKEGFRVVAADIDRSGLSELEKAGAVCRATDVASYQQVQDLVAFAVSKTGRLDVLSNNAGIGNRRRIENLRDGEFERMIEVHLYGAIYGMRAAIPVMRQQNYGRIINTISRAPEVDAPGNAANGAAKAAVWLATQVAAQEVNDSDILINAIIPGPTNTGLWGRDMPNMKPPEATFPTAHMLATLPSGGPSGQAFFEKQVYPMYDPNNVIDLSRELAPESEK